MSRGKKGENMKHKRNGLRPLVRSLRDERGQSLVLWALAMIPMLGFAGLAVNVGLVYFEKGQLRNAVDAAALAGAQIAAQTQTGTPDLTAARNLITTNDPYAKTVSASVQQSGNNVVSVAQQNVNGGFAALFGIHKFSMQASATAAIYPVSTVGSIVPIGVSPSTVTGTPPGKEVNLAGTGWKTNTDSPGNFGYLDPPGGSSLEYNLSHGVPGTWKINDPISTLPGKKVGQVRQGIDARIPNNTACQSYLTATASCSNVVITPVVTFTGNGANGIATIVGFAEFLLMPYNNGVNGYFIKMVSAGQADTSPGVTNYGADTVSLVK